jgi:hypothetical protein
MTKSVLLMPPGTFVDGSSTNGIVELRAVLLQRPEAFRTTITENLLLFGSGYPIGARRSADTLVRAREILHGVQNPKWSTVIAGVVRQKTQ